MNKREFFLKAMRADEYKRRAWVISAFSLINEGGEQWKTDPYPYRVVQMPTGHFFVDPENEGQLTKIDDAKTGEPPFSFKERIPLKKGDMPNVGMDIDTNYGNVLVNYLLLVYPFGHKVPFLTGKIKSRQVEQIIRERLMDTPPADQARDDKFLYVDEYKKFANAAFALVAYTQLCVPAATEKTMTPAEGIREFRDKLYAENAGKLHDPVVMAKIDAALVQYDRDWLKGDRGADYLISDKSLTIVRKKLFSTLGAEGGLSDSIAVNPIQTSLEEGWDAERFPQMNDTHRAGSFNRGHLTMLGGESVKWLLRASSNINIVKGDCGSKIGRQLDITPDTVGMLPGFSIVGKDGPIAIPDKEAAQQYLGKKVILRTPQYCKLKLTDFCECCVGVRLSANPKGASVAVAQYGSTLMYIFMAAGHGKAMTLAKFDWKKDIF